jgi:hypothetical protein
VKIWTLQDNRSMFKISENKVRDKESDCDEEIDDSDLNE